VLDRLAEAMAYLMAAHTSLVDSRRPNQRAGLRIRFAAAIELFVELNCELTLLAQRAARLKKEH
jgi:hypothetical protein